jgi:hypothetical protein
MANCLARHYMSTIFCALDCTVDLTHRCTFAPVCACAQVFRHFQSASLKRYVVTNPPTDLRLRADDIAFTLQQFDFGLTFRQRVTGIGAQTPVGP